MLATKLMSAMVGASGSGCYLGYLTSGDYPNSSPGIAQIIAYGNDQIYLTSNVRNQTYRIPSIIKLSDDFQIINNRGVSDSTQFNMGDFSFNGTYFCGVGDTPSSGRGLIRLNEARDSAVYRYVNTGSFAVRSAALTSDSGVLIGGLIKQNIFDEVFYDRRFIAKFDSSGSLAWQQFYQLNGSQQGEFNNILMDSSGNIYALGYGPTTVPNSSYASITKFNSSGTFVWGSNLSDIHSGACIDSSGNIFCTTQNQTITFVSKINSSGSILWTKGITKDSGASNLYSSNPTTDADGNVYCMFTAGSTPTATRGHVILLKFDSSGTLQWQKTIKQSTQGVISGQLASNQLSVKGNKLYFSMRWIPDGLTNYVLAGCIKTDGSVNGTANLGGYELVIASSSYTISTQSRTGSAQTSGQWEVPTYTAANGSSSTATMSVAISTTEL